MTERPSRPGWDDPTVLAQPMDATVLAQPMEATVLAQPMAPQADFVDAYVQHLQPPPLLPQPAQIVSLPPPPTALRERPRASEPPRMPVYPRLAVYPRAIPRMESTVGTRSGRRTAVVIVLFALAIMIGAMVMWQVTAT